MLNQSGIYQIRNTVNGKIYVGSAKILKRKTVLEWCEQYGLDRHVLRKRLNAGWEMHDALTRPKNSRGKA